jgi:glycosyltransferase involved in cell wall biosynthesis
LKQLGKNNDIHLVTLNQKNFLPTRDTVEGAVNVLQKICNRVDVFPIVSEKTKLRKTAMTITSYFNALPYDVNWLHNKDMLDFIDSLSRTVKYDVVHLDTLGLFQYSRSFKSTPIALSHHNIESSMMEKRYGKEKNILKKAYFKKEAVKIRDYEDDICSVSDLNVVVSELDGSRLKEIKDDLKVAVIPNGVDVDYFKPSSSNFESKQGLVFAGGMSYYPNREAVLYFVRDIWPILCEDNNNRKATIIGRNPPKELLGITKTSNVVAPGFVDDVRPYLDEARIYICPITNGGGTRLKILDALAMAKPLVATGFAVEGLDLVEEKHYLRAETPREFAVQINRLEKDSDLCNRIANAGRKYVEDNYSWDIIGNKFDAEYRKMAGLT